jgi:hypothetical protein
MCEKLFFPRKLDCRLANVGGICIMSLFKTLMVLNAPIHCCVYAFCAVNVNETHRHVRRTQAYLNIGDELQFLTKGEIMLAEL